MWIEEHFSDGGAKDRMIDKIKNSGAIDKMKKDSIDKIKNYMGDL